jgi:hypothetical protein
VGVKSFGFISVSGGRSFVGKRRPVVWAAADVAVMVAAGRVGFGAGCGDRLPLLAAEVAGLVSGGDR